MRGSFSITLHVDPAPPPPLSLDATESLGVAGVQLPDGTVLPIKGGTPPYTINQVSGSVPPGVTINNDGSESGTPSQAGDFPITLDISDANG